MVMRTTGTGNSLFPCIFSLTVINCFIYKGAFNSWLQILSFQGVMCLRHSADLELKDLRANEFRKAFI